MCVMFKWVDEDECERAVSGVGCLHQNFGHLMEKWSLEPRVVHRGADPRSPLSDCQRMKRSVDNSVPWSSAESWRGKRVKTRRTWMLSYVKLC